MSQEAKLGRLDVMPKLSIGKKIDEWTFYSPFKDSMRIVVKVLERKGQLVMQASALEVGSRKAEMFVPIIDTDIESLRAKVLEACIGYDQVKNGVTWVDWLEVEIYRPAKPSVFATNEANLRIRYHIVRKATLVDGREVTINRNNLVSDFPKPKAAGEEDEGAMWGRRELTSEFAYLPSTPENIATLEAMVNGLNTLHARVSEFVRAAGLTGRIELNDTLLLGK